MTRNCRCSDVDVRPAQALLQRRHFEPFHRRLQRIDGIDFRDDDPRAEAAERMGGTFADVPVSAHQRDLAGDHHVGGALDSVGQRFAAAVKIVELRLRHRVVDVDRRHQQLARLVQLIEAVHAGRRLLRDAAPFLDDAVPAPGILLVHPQQQVLDHLFLLGSGGRFHPIAPLLQFISLVDEQGDVSAVVNHQLRSQAARMRQGLVGAVPVFLQRLSFPGKHGDAGPGDGGRRMILRGENVAGRPPDRCAQFHQGLDQHRGLHRHVQGSGDPSAGQRFQVRIFLAHCHQAGHLLLGDLDGTAAQIGQREITNLKV